MGRQSGAINFDQLKIGEQWQNRWTREAAYILSIEPYSPPPRHGHFTVYFEADGIKYNLPWVIFSGRFEHIPHMKGAYK